MKPRSLGDLVGDLDEVPAGAARLLTAAGTAVA
jgi:hypothetical protein